MAWTNVQKPTTSDWVNTNPTGRTQYDQADVFYDDATIFYDGGDPNLWTDVSRPNAKIIRVGMATGLIMPPTYAVEREIGSQWTKVPKAT